MTYTIKEVAEKMNLSIYTLRFYDKQGLLPFVARNQSGYREFTDGDLNLLKTICCLKNTGMKIKDIHTYIDYVMAGPSSIAKRKKLLLDHRQTVLAEQQKIAKSLAEIDYKLDIYGADNAEQLVATEYEFVSMEKEINHLPNPFRTI